MEQNILFHIYFIMERIKINLFHNKINMSRNYCFTNFDLMEHPLVESNFSDKVRYVVWQIERCPKTNKLHHQGYVEFSDKVRVKGAQSALGLSKASHFEYRNGTRDEARNYCMKEDTRVDGPWEYGSFESGGQGRRNDIETVKEKIKKGESILSIHDSTNSFQAIKFAESYIRYAENKRFWKPNVLWFYGPKGTGKTRAAIDLLPNAWISEDTLKWWTGYDAHENVILDDFREDSTSFVKFLRITDRYPCRIEYKGGARQLLAKNIIITCPHHPKETWGRKNKHNWDDGNTFDEDIDQVLRRLDLIVFFKETQSETEYQTSLSEIREKLLDIQSSNSSQMNCTKQITS